MAGASRAGVTGTAVWRGVVHRRLGCRPMSASNGQGSDHDDPVAKNRAVHPRRTPGRPELGADVTRRAAIAAMLVVGAATVILLVVLAGSN